MNQNLAQLGRQLAAIWSQLGLNQKISVVIAGGAVVAGLLGIALWSRQVDYSLLYGRLEDGEAAKVIGALNETKTPYKVGGGGGSIYVPADKVYSLRMQLQLRGIPSKGVGFEIFDKPNFGISDFVQHANYLRAVKGELERTIGQLDEVESASVMIVMPENRLVVDNQKKATAAVQVKTRGRVILQPQVVNSIRFLVASSVEGLQPTHVTVTDSQGNTLSENAEEDSIAGMTTSQLQARRNLEQYLSKKAEGMLERVLGPGQAVVRVSADLSFDTVTLEDVKYSPDTVPKMETKTDENNQTETASSSGGVAGVATNSNTETNAAAGGSSPVTNSKIKKTQTTTEYEVSKVTSNVVHAAGQVRRISAAVFIASRVTGTGTALKETPRSKEELEKLRRIVQSALGVQNGKGDSRNDEVTLEEITFNEQHKVEITKQLDKQQQWQMVGEGLRLLGYPGLALLIIMSFWRSFKKTPAENIPIGIPLGQFASANGNGSGGNGHGGNGNGRGNGYPGLDDEPSVVTPEVLNRLIRENPENMSLAIRGWLTRGKPVSK